MRVCAAALRRELRPLLLVFCDVLTHRPPIQWQRESSTGTHEMTLLTFPARLTRRFRFGLQRHNYAT